METLKPIVTELSVADLFLKWKRHASNQYYTLDFSCPGLGSLSGLARIYKQAKGGYTDVSGKSFRLLADAKKHVFGEIKNNLLELLEVINQQLKAADSAPLKLSIFEYKALGTIISRAMRLQLENLPSLLTKRKISYDRLRDEHCRFGNALAAFDAAGIMFSILEPRLYHSYSQGHFLIRKNKLFLAITADRDGRYSPFGDDGWLEIPFTQITPKGIRLALEEVIDAVVPFAA